MLARLVLGIALLWAVVVPALHGHPAGQAAHLHEAAHTGAGHAGFDGAVEAATGVVTIAPHQHVEGAAGHDLPVATPISQAGMIAVLVLVFVAPRGSEHQTGWRPTTNLPRVRGSPVARHEVART